MVDDPLDIFDPKHIYPTQDSAPERDKGKKSILNMNTNVIFFNHIQKQLFGKENNEQKKKNTY